MRPMKIALAASALLASHAFATPISGASGMSAPPLAGATEVMDFDYFPNQTFTNARSMVGNVVVSGVGGADLRIDDSWIGQFNSRGLHYMDNNQGDTLGILFQFVDPVSAFAFNWGAADAEWTLRAFDSSDNLLESMVINPTTTSNNGDYFGFADAHIKYATLTTDSYDWVFVDNIAVVQESSTNLPEPASLALFGAAAGAAALARRRRRKLRG